MNIGIIVFSQTGNTFSVAEKLKSALAAKGHGVAVDSITIEGEVNSGKPNACGQAGPRKIRRAGIRAPVMAFMLNPVMKAYLAQMPGIKGKKTACFTTQHLPAGWMGGNRALRTMSASLKKKGAQVFKGGIVHWKDEQKRSLQTDSVVEAICGGF